MHVVEFSGTAGSFATADGRVRKVFVAGVVLFGAAAPDDAPDPTRAEALVLAAANAVLAAPEGEGSRMLEALGSAETQDALGRRVEQRVGAELPARVTARVLELHVRSADEAPAQAQVVEPPPAAEVAAPVEVAPEPAAPALGKGSRVYVVGADRNWYPGMCLDAAPGYLLIDFGGGRVEWVGEAYCAPG